MFTKLFSLALFFFMVGIAGTAYAQCTPFTISEDSVVLTTDLSDLCDGGQVTYEVVGFENAEYAFNYDGNVEGGFTEDNTITTYEGATFSVDVRILGATDTCYSTQLIFTSDEIDSMYLGSAEVEQPTCYDDKSEISLTAVGGYAPFSYYVVPEADWAGTTGVYTPKVTSTKRTFNYAPKVSGMFYVAVTNDAGCVDLTDMTSWETVTVNAAPSQLNVLDITATNPDCYGQMGMVSVTVEAGLGTPYASGEYMVSIDGTDSTKMTTAQVATFMLPAGEYYATVTDSVGCEEGSESAVVTVPEQLAFTIDITDVSCAEAGNGKIVATITNDDGTSAYGAKLVDDEGVATMYTSVADSIVMDGLNPVYYSLYVWNETLGCDTVEYYNKNKNGNSIAVQSLDEIIFDVEADSIVCNGDSVWVSIANVSGGSGEYEYRLKDTDAGTYFGVFSDVSSWLVPAGEYQAIVKDKNEDTAGTNCRQRIDFSLGQPEEVAIASVTTISPACYENNDGKITIVATGGSDLRYSIDSVQWYVNNKIAVAAGTYTAYVKDLNCGEQVVSQSGVEVIALAPNVIEVSAADTLVECNGADDASVTIDVTSWASQSGETRDVSVYYASEKDSAYVGGTLADEIVLGESVTVSDLAPGTYYFWAVDNFGCVFDAGKDGSSDYLTVTVAENAALSLAGTVTENATCYGDQLGVITLKYDGGSESDYKYGIGNSLKIVSSMAVTAMDDWTADVDSIEIQAGAGTYYAVIYDTHCDNRAYAGPFTVEGNEAVTIDSVLSVTDIVCYGDVNGVIEIPAAQGGAGDLVYTLQQDIEDTWTDVSGYVQVSTTVFDSLAAGDYKVVVTDLGGCDGTETETVTVEGPESAVEIGWTEVDSITCNGASDGKVRFAVEGGTAPYYYKIGSTSWQEVPTSMLATSSLKSASGLSDVESEYILITEPGDYTIKVKDALGCVADEDFDFTIAEPEAITLALDKKDATFACGPVNGDLMVDVYGGNTNVFTIEVYVDTVSTPMITVSGVADSSETFTGLDAGMYTVVVTEEDGNDCSETATITITKPDTISFDAEVTADVLCNGDSTGVITLSNITGGTEDYFITVRHSDGAPVMIDMEQDSSVWASLPAGYYDVHVTDGHCETLVDSLYIEQPEALTLEAEAISDITCTEAGQFSVTADGGAGEYMYFAAITDVATGHILVDIPDVATDSIWQTDSIFTVSEAGTYVVWAKDANNCLIGGEENDEGTVINEWRVKIEAPAVEIMVDAVVTGAPKCNGDLTAEITVPAENVAIYVDDVLVDMDYTVTIDGVEMDTLSDVGAGTYVVMVTNEDGCYATDTVVITEPEVLEVALAEVEGEFTCPDVTEGFIKATAWGGDSTSIKFDSSVKSASATEAYSDYYQFQLWQDGVLKTDYTNVDAFLVTVGHTYQVVVKDYNGCTDTSEVITIDPVEAIDFTVENVTCYGETAGSVKVTATGEEGRSFQVQWEQIEDDVTIDSGSSDWFTESIEIIETFVFDDDDTHSDSHYAFTVVDTMGCTATAVDTMTFNDDIQAAVSVLVTEGEVEGCGTEVTITPAGGVSPYMVTINGEVTEDMTVVLGGGTYEIVVADSHQRCAASQTITLAYPLAVVDSVVTYTGEPYMYTYEEAGLMDSALYAGDYTFYYAMDSTCTNELVVIVSEKDRTAPVLDTVSPMDTIADNHPTFEIVFEDVVTFNDSVVGYLTVTPADSTESVLDIEITADMLDGNMLTIDYVVGGDVAGLDKNTTYVVAVDSGIVIGDGLAWDGVVADWTFTTGADFATGIDDDIYSAAEYNIYPNPCTEYVKIENSQALTRVVITNIAGQRVIDIENPDSEEINTSNLVSGVYVVTLISDSEIVKSERIIKK